jgi:hypothetical protein
MHGAPVSGGDHHRPRFIPYPLERRYEERINLDLSAVRTGKFGAGKIFAQVAHFFTSVSSKRRLSLSGATT